jgi:hypothetical protein
MACKFLIVDVTVSDLTAADDGVVYFRFIECGAAFGETTEIGYTSGRSDFDTGYCMDVTAGPSSYEAFILVGGVETTPTGGSGITEGATCSGSDPVEVPTVIVPPPYGKKYTLSAVGKSGHTFTAEIWEKEYTGATYQINTSTNPFVLDCLASGDDPFQPILPTTFTIRADFTEFAGPWPDFLSTDDRKYHVRFYAQGTTYLLWKGFILMDTISLPFTTGRQIVDIICVDALALLKSVNYIPGVALLTSTETLLQTINNCLAYLLYPGGYKLNFGTNYYTSAMADTNNSFRQIYVTQCNWQDDSDSYLSCYDILEIIMTAFGAQLYQSGGEWWVTSVNERTNSTLRIFQTDQNSAADVQYNKSIGYTIQPYLNNVSTPFYFINNEQVKTLSKGFQIVEVNGDVNYCYNKLINGDFAKLSNITVPAPNGTPDNWTTAIGTGGSVTKNIVSGITGLALDSGTTNTTLLSTPVLIDEFDKVNLTFQAYKGNNSFLHIEIKIDVGGGNFYKYGKALGAEPAWLYNPSTSAGAYRYEVGASATPQPVTIETVGAPASGTLEISFRVGFQVSGAATQAFFANARLTFQSLYTKAAYKNFNSSSPYKKEVSVKLGAYTVLGVVISRSQSQSLLTVSNNGLINWTRYGDSSVTYSNLALLLLSQYFNIFSKPRVNLSFTQYNVFNQSGNYFIGLVNSFAVTDPSGTISVNAFKYILGACTIDYVNNTISGTGLQVANTNLTYTTDINLTLNK